MPVTIKKRWGQTGRILVRLICSPSVQSIGGKLDRLLAACWSSGNGLKSRPSVRTTVAMASHSSVVSPLYRVNFVNDWQARRNSCTSSRMTAGSMAHDFTRSTGAELGNSLAEGNSAGQPNGKAGELDLVTPTNNIVTPPPSHRARFSCLLLSLPM